MSVFIQEYVGESQYCQKCQEEHYWCDLCNTYHHIDFWKEPPKQEEWLQIDSLDKAKDALLQNECIFANEYFVDFDDKQNGWKGGRWEDAPLLYNQDLDVFLKEMETRYPQWWSGTEYLKRYVS